MKSVFNQNDKAELINRINRLTNEKKAEWGKMNVGQMLAHVQEAMNVGIGRSKLKRSFIGILFGGMAKKKMLKTAEFSKNLPTDKSFVVNDDREVSKEKEKLIDLLTTISEGGHAILTKDPHPFFGKMTNDEWDLLTWKHIDHHLRQFGV